MANKIPMTTREAIKALKKRGYSKRKIARELGIHRNTVAHYLGERPSGSEPAKGKQSDSKCTISTPGSEPDPGPDLESPQRASEGENDESEEPDEGSGPGRQSHCERYRAIIKALKIRK